MTITISKYTKCASVVTEDVKMSETLVLCQDRPNIKYGLGLCSASSHELSVPRTRLSTYGDRAFPVAAVRIWNSLPQHITSAPSLPVFCSRLKTYLLWAPAQRKRATMLYFANVYLFIYFFMAALFSGPG